MRDRISTTVTNQSPDAAAKWDWHCSIATLLGWLKDPAQLEDDGIDAPSDVIIRLSLDVAEHFARESLPPPQRLVPDPNGGIVFERHEGGYSEIIHVWDDGEVEWQLFHRASLIDRSPLSLWPSAVADSSSRDFLAPCH